MAMIMRKKTLTKKQNKLIDLLFDGNDLEAALKETGISVSLYRKWVETEEWKKECDLRIEALNLESKLILAVFRPIAAAKLIGLTDCEVKVTQRLACLDIINMGSMGEEKEKTEKETEGQKLEISDKQSAEILKILRTKGSHT